MSTMSQIAASLHATKKLLHTLSAAFDFTCCKDLASYLISFGKTRFQGGGASRVSECELQ